VGQEANSCVEDVFGAIQQTENQAATHILRTTTLQYINCLVNSSNTYF
jgi:hypothetical protein